MSEEFNCSLDKKPCDWDGKLCSENGKCRYPTELDVCTTSPTLTHREYVGKN